MTRDGYERLQTELEELITVHRPTVARWLREAREDGGEPGENAGVADALEEREQLERRIAELRHRLGEARIVEPTLDGTIGIGAFVRLRTAGGPTIEYQLVGAAEADPAQRRLSVESPVGAALVGLVAGDDVEVEAPGGRHRFEIVEFQYAAEAVAA
jgi:transcription elongation factor GreA